MHRKKKIYDRRSVRIEIKCIVVFWFIILWKNAQICKYTKLLMNFLHFYFPFRFILSPHHCLVEIALHWAFIHMQISTNAFACRMPNAEMFILSPIAMVIAEHRKSKAENCYRGVLIVSHRIKRTIYTNEIPETYSEFNLDKWQNAMGREYTEQLKTMNGVYHANIPTPVCKDSRELLFGRKNILFFLNQIYPTDF